MFTSEEVRAIWLAARAVTDAADAGDPAGRADRFADLQSLLTGLRARYGDHPTLLETEADFTPDPWAAIALYVRAACAALAHGLPAPSVRQSLARLLVKVMGRPEMAWQVLDARREEAPDGGGPDAATWAALLAACPDGLPAALQAELARPAVRAAPTCPSCGRADVVVFPVLPPGDGHAEAPPKLVCLVCCP
jgi:hypothetical protein